MKDLITAIDTKLTGSALSTNVGGRVFFGLAPQGAEYPYIVILNIPDAPMRIWGDIFENFQIQFSLFSISESVAEISTMYENLKVLFDETALTIAGSTHIWTKRLGTPATMVEDHTTPGGSGDSMSQVRHWAVDYNILVQDT